MVLQKWWAGTHAATFAQVAGMHVYRSCSASTSTCPLLIHCLCKWRCICVLAYCFCGPVPNGSWPGKVAQGLGTTNLSNHLIQASIFFKRLECSAVLLWIKTHMTFREWMLHLMRLLHLYIRIFRGLIIKAINYWNYLHYITHIKLPRHTTLYTVFINVMQ